MSTTRYTHNDTMSVAVVNDSAGSPIYLAVMAYCCIHALWASCISRY